MLHVIIVSLYLFCNYSPTLRSRREESPWSSRDIIFGISSNWTLTSLNIKVVNNIFSLLSLFCLSNITRKLKRVEERDCSNFSTFVILTETSDGMMIWGVSCVEKNTIFSFNLFCNIGNLDWTSGCIFRSTSTTSKILTTTIILKLLFNQKWINRQICQSPRLKPVFFLSRQSPMILIPHILKVVT